MGPSRMLTREVSLRNTYEQFELSRSPGPDAPVPSPCSRWTSVLRYGVTVCLCALILTLTLRLWRADLSIPWKYSDDALCLQMWIKGLIEHGWYLNNPTLGMPYGMNLAEFPLSDSLHFSFLKLLATVAPSPSAAINLYFLLTFPLAACSSLFVLRRLGVADAPAITFSLLFAFLPYHFGRGVNHLFLSGYFLIPVMVLLILRIYQGQPLLVRDVSRPTPIGMRRLTLLVFCLAFASAGVYYAFFACYFLVLAGLAASFRERRKGPILDAGMLIATLLVGFGLNISPYVHHVFRHGANREAALRHWTESEFYGLRVTQMLLPNADHRLPRFQQPARRYNAHAAMTNDENRMTSLGMIGSAGFLLLIGRLLWPKGPGPNLLDGLAMLCIFAVLLATVGGFGSLFAQAVSPSIRVYARISIFVAFFGLAALALCFKDRSRPIYWAPFGLLLALGLWDQTHASFVPRYADLKSEYDGDACFVKRIEASVAANTMVFQLPYCVFPEPAPVVKMLTYDLGRPYLHSTTLRWSYGGMRGREADRFQREIAALPPDEMVKRLRESGFGGIYLDRNGFEDRGTALELSLRHILKKEYIVSDNGRFVFYSLAAE